MQRIGQLLANSAPGHEDRATIKAAAIIAAAATALRRELHLAPAEAQVIVYRRHEVIIRVAHGAIGGLVTIHQERLLGAINRAVSKLYPGRQPTVERLIIRQN